MKKRKKDEEDMDDVLESFLFLQLMVKKPRSLQLVERSFMEPF